MKDENIVAGEVVEDSKEAPKKLVKWIVYGGAAAGGLMLAGLIGYLLRDNSEKIVDAVEAVAEAATEVVE